MLWTASLSLKTDFRSATAWTRGVRCRAPAGLDWSYVWTAFREAIFLLAATPEASSASPVSGLVVILEVRSRAELLVTRLARRPSRDWPYT